jgi:outer membrane phospholipase A
MAMAQDAAPPAPPAPAVAHQNQSSPQAAPVQEFPFFSSELGLFANEPTYIVFDHRNGLEARFQLSLNYQIIGRYPVVRPLHATFTTTSLWDLHSTSKPFRDSTYRPGLDWTWAFPNPNFTLDTGWEHESNGRGPDPGQPESATNDDDLSRSLNRFYARGNWTWFDGRFLFAPKVVWNYDKADQNADIDRYRGYCDWLVKWQSQSHNGYVASLFFRQGTDPEHHFVEADFGLPWNVFFKDANGWILFQYLYGYGQTLRDYNVKNHGTFSLGFMIVP